MKHSNAIFHRDVETTPLNEVPILVCDCGKRLRAPGARPGRLGRCPACGGELRVPDAVPAATDFDPVPDPPRPKKRKKKSKQGGETEIWDGLVRPPSHLETTLGESLLYPFWGATGVALLIIFPPILTVVSAMVFLVVGAFQFGSGLVKLMSVVWTIPIGLGLLGTCGFLLLYFGGVLSSSAVGEIHQPRWPDWEMTSIARGIGRWTVALVAGLVVGGLPSIAYWITCGDVDLFDLMILSELAAVGAIYALMALLASILHEDAMGGNPFTVFRAIRKVGFGYVEPCLVAGGAVGLAGTVLALALKLDNPLLSIIFFYGFWVVGLYETMVVLRVLGLFYRKYAKALGWFRGRTGWSG